jgi:hypothetical protein
MITSRNRMEKMSKTRIHPESVKPLGVCVTALSRMRITPIFAAPDLAYA